MTSTASHFQKAKYLCSTLKESSHTQKFAFTSPLHQQVAFQHDVGPPSAARHRARLRTVGEKVVKLENLNLYTLFQTEKQYLFFCSRGGSPLYLESYLKLWNYIYCPSIRPVVSVPLWTSSASVRPSILRVVHSVVTRPLSVRPSRRRR